MRKAKVIKEHKDYPELKLDDIVYVWNRSRKCRKSDSSFNFN